MHMDVFKDDAFGVVTLSKAIEDTPFQPGRIGQLGLFSEEPISTTSVSIEKIGSTISLVPAGTRGSSGQALSNDKRQMIPFNAIHLPQRDGINADEMQNVRAFGSETDVQVAQAVMSRKLGKMRRNLDTTIEWQRMGAIKGQVLDSNGTDVLLDLHTAFGTVQSSHNMVLGTAGTKVLVKAVEAKRKMEAALGNLMYSGLSAMCSATFFDALVSHPAVEKAYDRWMNGEFLRNDQRNAAGTQGFYFAGIYWEEYRGQVGATKFVADGEAYLVPAGVPDLFVTNYAPADYMETVNTPGLAYYAKQWNKEGDKGIVVEAQSNPIHICTRPQVPVRLLAA